MSTNLLCAGFARVNITPPLGVGITGYFEARHAKGVLDELEANAIAVSCGHDKAVFISIDTLSTPHRAMSEQIRNHIAEVTEIPFEGVFMCATHIHTGPMWGRRKPPQWASDEVVKLSEEYAAFMYRRLGDVAKMAVDDLKPAHLGYAIGNVPGISFVRRYFMKDGSIQTNPGVNNPNIDKPVGTPDERVNVLRFVRENADDILLVNFGTHPDVIGGEFISADWPGFTRRTLEKTLPNIKCAFFNGAQGDVNHINVFPKALPDSMKNQAPKTTKGYEHARFMGQAVAGAVLQVFGDLQFVDVDSVRFAQKIIDVPSNMPQPSDMDNAYRIAKLHEEGKDDEIPNTGMGKVTLIAEAQRMIALEHGPAAFPMTIAVIAFGKMALVGIPGEPFTRIGTGIKATDGWDVIMPCCNSNTAEGYFPMYDSYAEGGYEARSSRFKAGVGELIVKEAKELLDKLKL